MNNETKHTAGNWEAIGLPDNTYQIYGDNEAGTAEFVASVQGNELMKNLANARLIAAAPELLFYLTKLLEADKNGNFDEFDKHIDGAYQATRKATHG